MAAPAAGRVMREVAEPCRGAAAEGEGRGSALATPKSASSAEPVPAGHKWKRKQQHVKT